MNAGTASRFFYSAQHDCRCALCDLLCEPIASENGECNASNAASFLPANESAASVLIDVQEPSPLVSGASGHPLKSPAANVASYSEPCHRPMPSTAQQLVPDWPLSKIVRNVRSAASLCASCATAIAQSLARARRNPGSLSPPLAECTFGQHANILCQCLALYVEGRESTDTILTIPSLSTLFGSVFHAIAESTKSAASESSGNTEYVPTRFHYSAKADKSDRADSRHPTVKPIDLMRWLVRLITPPGGTVLDPFAGSGTTGEAAMLEGLDALLIEQDEQHVADVRHRINRWQGGDMPLFASAAD